MSERSVGRPAFHSTGIRTVTAGKSDNKIVALLSKPGLMLQHLTTREPEPEMAEVAIAAVEAVFDWRSYLKENFPEQYGEKS